MTLEGNDVPETTASPQEDRWTVRRILEWTTSHLKKHGSDSPRLDAEILLAHTRHCSRIALYTNFDDELTDAHRQTMRELVQRRAKAEPVAYLVGHREFFSLDFEVNREVLIPRPDTETLVLKVIELLKPLSGPKLLELGTGSGCIAIALAKHLPTAVITAVDISSTALEVAGRNAKRHGVEQRIEFLEGDLWAALPADHDKFDAVVSNPPYICSDEIQTLDADVAKHEPHLALDGGSDGLTFYRRILADATKWLKPGGLLAVECSGEQAEPIQLLVESTKQFGPVQVTKDAAGKLRVVTAVANLF